jgi:4'-phosphopantetheinyl transferase
MVQPTLVADEIHLWHARLQAPPNRVETLRQSLSVDEVARAERFRLAKHRDRFIIARGALRAVLARYQQIGPARLSFVYGPLGKPALADASAAMPIRFNLSHSGDWALVAVALGRELGVDIERHRSVSGLDGMVERFFSAGERAAIMALPVTQRPAAFFRYWTVKEAYLKARGTGLSSPLNQFEVTFTSGAAPVIHDAQGNEDRQWSCCEVPFEPGYSTAMVAEGRGWQLRCWDVPEGD